MMEIRWLNKRDGTRILQYRIQRMDFVGKITVCEWEDVKEIVEPTNRISWHDFI